MRSLIRFLPLAVLILTASGCGQKEETTAWPVISAQQKPWTRWWWHGSALTKEGITIELEAYAKAGLGGVEITPIYGVHGHEDKFVQFLSDEWMGLLIHTLHEADRLGLGVDMATGTGWPFGGPWVSDSDASRNIYHKVYEVGGGQSLREKISFTQPPFLRAVGSQVYEVHDNADLEGRVVAGTRKEPLQKFDPKNIKIEQLRQPVSANDDLQSLALDQVQFERQLPLVAIVAYHESGESINLISSVDQAGNLNWVAPPGNWRLYAAFQGWHGKMVERAGPGGEGNVIDHFSSVALSNYLKRFDSAFSHHNITSLRAFFNDSYEVDDARGAADWTPSLVEEFSKRRRYNLLSYLPQLFGEGNPEESEKVLYDYRLTISELLQENFTQPWAQWAHDKNKIVRNQAHGAPANILDLYAEVDIPETEGVEPMRIRMATSAGHVTGKKLISSESATWLDEHFLSGLGDIKQNVDRYLANGVNHILYHGTSYSPPGEPWPGWLFYAAVHLNPRNPQWDDFAALNRYIARCQSFLQQGTAYSDVLLYYPIADRLSFRGAEMVEHFDSPVNAFKGSAFMAAADTLLATGYTFDFISDQQLQQVKYSDGQLLTTGGSRYKTVVVPQCKYMPIGTMRKLMALVGDGANVVFYKGMPTAMPGLTSTETDQQEFIASVEVLSQKTDAITSNLPAQLELAGIPGEELTALGISFARRKLENGSVLYFIVNTSEQYYQGNVAFGTTANSAVIRDPMTGSIGGSRQTAKSGPTATSVFLQLSPGQSLLLELSERSSALPDFDFKTAGDPVATLADWKLEFINGGPVLPALLELDSLTDWTSLSDPDLQRFSGTGVYSTNFSRPSGKDGSWMLGLGAVHGSVTIIFNGDSLATLINAPYEVLLDGARVKESNLLQVKVSNLMANRIADLDRQGILWKKFYNVNFPARKPENRRQGIFFSGEWKPLPSGLSGPVTVSAVNRP